MASPTINVFSLWFDDVFFFCSSFKKLCKFTSRSDAFNCFFCFLGRLCEQVLYSIGPNWQLHASLSQMFLRDLDLCVTVPVVDKFCCFDEPFYDCRISMYRGFSWVIPAYTGTRWKLFSGPVTQVNDYVIMSHPTLEWVWNIHDDSAIQLVGQIDFLCLC